MFYLDYLMLIKYCLQKSSVTNKVRHKRQMLDLLLQRGVVGFESLTMELQDIVKVARHKGFKIYTGFKIFNHVFDI